MSLGQSPMVEHRHMTLYDVIDIGFGEDLPSVELAPVMILDNMICILTTQPT